MPKERGGFYQNHLETELDRLERERSELRDILEAEQGELLTAAACRQMDELKSLRRHVARLYRVEVPE